MIVATYARLCIDTGSVDSSFPGLGGTLVPHDRCDRERHTGGISVDLDENSEPIILSN
jgi:hypothetical protein